jgi:hypothetical protein
VAACEARTEGLNGVAVLLAVERRHCHLFHRQQRDYLVAFVKLLVKEAEGVALRERRI